MRGIAERAGSIFRDFGRIRAVFDRRQRVAIFGLIFSQKEFVVFSW